MHHISSRLRHKNFLGHSIGALVQEQHSLLALRYTFSLVSFSIIKHWIGTGINNMGNVAKEQLAGLGRLDDILMFKLMELQYCQQYFVRGFPI
jgi:hypothetical protein